LGYSLALYNPPQLARIVNPAVAPPSPSADSPEGQAITRRIEESLQSLPIVRQLREAERTDLKVAADVPQSAGKKWVESRPYLHYNPEKRVHSLTAGALRGPGKLAVPPLVFSTRDDRESIIIIHLGRSICGHDGIVHGGLLATILDEGLARTAILALPSQIGVTASLNIEYRAPTMADQFVVLHSQCHKVEGRKAWAEAWLENLDGTLLVQAKALFVEPKMAKLILGNTSIREVLG